MKKRLLKIGKIIVVLILILVAATAAIYAYTSATSKNSLYKDVADVPSYNVALVLGTSKYTTKGGRNMFFYNRIEAAWQLYNSGKVKKILVSGDNGQIEYNEPIDMYNALAERGIPKKDIVLDYAGFRTFDSMVRAKEIFGQDSFVVVSQKFHLQRAIFIARSQNIHATGFIAADPPYSANKVFLREYFARTKAFLDCYILRTSPRFLGEKEHIDI